MQAEWPNTLKLCEWRNETDVKIILPAITVILDNAYGVIMSISRPQQIGAARLVRIRSRPRSWMYQHVYTLTGVEAITTRNSWLLVTMKRYICVYFVISLAYFDRLKLLCWCQNSE